MAAGGPPASRFVIAAGGQRAGLWWCGLRQASGSDGGAASPPTSYAAPPTGSAPALVLSSSTASAILSSWCAKSGGAGCLERSGRHMIAMLARWLHRSAVVVPAWLRWSAHDSRISATFVDGTTTFGRTARARLKAPMQPGYTLLTARSRLARYTGAQVFESSPSSRNGAITMLSKVAAMTQSRACFISNRTQIAIDFFGCH